MGLSRRPGVESTLWSLCGCVGCGKGRGLTDQHLWSNRPALLLTVRCPILGTDLRKPPLGVCVTPPQSGRCCSVLGGSVYSGLADLVDGGMENFRLSSSWCVAENCPIPKRQLNRLQQETKIWQHLKQLGRGEVWGNQDNLAEL